MGLDIDSGSSDASRMTNSKGNVQSIGSLFEMEKTRMYLVARFSSFREKVNMDTLRPLPIFLGFSASSLCLAPDAFTPPSKHMDKSTVEKIRQRFDLNFAYFISNYALIAAGTCIVVILLHPKMIIYSCIVYAFWKAHNIMVKENIPLIVMEKDIGQYVSVEARTKILYAITCWVVVMYCLKPFLLASGLTLLMVATHAIMRDPKQIENAKSCISYKDESDDENYSSGSEVLVENFDSTIV